MCATGREDDEGGFRPQATDSSILECSGAHLRRAEARTSATTPTPPRRGRVTRGKHWSRAPRLIARTSVLAKRPYVTRETCMRVVAGRVTEMRPDGAEQVGQGGRTAQSPARRLAGRIVRLSRYDRPHCSPRAPRERRKRRNTRPAFIVTCPSSVTSPRGGHVTRRRRRGRALRSLAWASPSRGTSRTGCLSSAPTSREGCASA